MRLGMAAALTAALVGGMALSAGENPAKKPQGSYSRTKDDTLSRFTFTPDGLLFFADGPLGKMDVEADYGVSKDGKTIYGRVRTVKEGSGPAKGDLFSFAFKAKADTLTITDWKGTGIVGLASGLQGDYQAEKKKE